MGRGHGCRSGWCAPCPEAARGPSPLQSEPDAGSVAGRALAAHDRGLTIRLEAQDGRDVGVEERRDLLGYRGEDHVGRHSARHEQREPSQGGLLLGDPAQLVARLRVGDRGRDEPGKGLQTVLRPLRQSRLLRRGDGEHAPDPTLHADRGADRRPDAEVARDLHRGCVVAGGIAVHPHGLVGLVDERGHVVPTKWQPGRPLHVAVPVPAPDDHSTAHFVAGDRRPLGVEQAAHLFGNRGEDRGARGSPGHESRDTLQRGLFLHPALALPGATRGTAHASANTREARDAAGRPTRARAGDREGETTLLSVSIPRD